MIQRNIDHWHDFDGRQGLLLFAQALDELLDPHAHDSHKVPALNFHYICYEIYEVIELVEDSVLDRGNLIPLFAEMRDLYTQDPIAQKILKTDFDRLFATKNSFGEYDKKPISIDNGKDAERDQSKLKSVVQYILSEFRRNQQYYTLLTHEIKDLVRDCCNDLTKMMHLVDLTRIFASEVINFGYSQTYLSDFICSFFFNSSIPVTSAGILDSFFELLISSKHDYCVYLPIMGEQQKQALRAFDTFEIENNVYEMFCGCPFVLKYQCKAIDPYRAREIVVDLVNVCFSVGQFIQHNKHSFNPKYAEVVDLESKNCTFLRRPEATLTKRDADKDEMSPEDLLNACTNLPPSIMQVIQLHASALISHNAANQIINLWTAIEVAVPVIRKESLSRINQVSNVLTAVLGSTYFSEHLSQLLLDIKKANESLLDKVNTLPFDGSLHDKLLAVLVLSDHADTYSELMDELKTSTPLLACRMHRYHEQWSSTNSIKNAYQRHSKRLSQQIMRIYRTRNMLVHDDSEMPFTDYVLQNLHYYLDSFIKFISQQYRKGYRSIQTIIDAAKISELCYLDLLDKTTPITKDNMLLVILQREQ